MNEQLKHSLQQIAADNIPDDVNLWPTTKQRMQPRRVTQVPRRMLPTTRLGWAAMAIMIVLPLGAALGFRTLYDSDAGLQHIQKANLGQQLGLSQTVNGFTIDLEQVYVEANRIVLEYTISGATLQVYDPEGDKSLFPSMQLSDEHGTEFPISEIRYSPPENETMEGLASFDASAMENAPERLHLVMELHEVQQVPDPLQESTSHAIASPISFDFDVVANAERRAVDVQQTVTSAGIAVTLKQVRISPTAAYATVCVDAPGGMPSHWLSSGRLVTGAGQADLIQSNASSAGTKEVGCHTLQFFAPHYYERGGEWTLTLTGLTAPDHVTGHDQQVTGDWTFTFDVPQP